MQPKNKKTEVAEEVQPVDPKEGKKAKDKSVFFLEKYLVSNKDRDFFSEHMAMMLMAGMDVLEALRTLAREVRSKYYRRVIDQIASRVEDGFPLWESVSEKNLLSPHIVALIRVGEESGRLSENLRIVADQQKKDREFGSKLRSAMLYPVFVLSLSVVVGLGIAWFILPRLAVVFASLRIELPTITKILINTGTFLGAYGVYVIPAVLVFFALFIFIFFIFSRTRFIGQWLLFHTPGIGRVVQEVQLARLGFILGTLLEAGLPILDSITALEQATTFSQFKKFYRHLREKISEGNSFGNCFENYPEIDRMIPLVAQQIIISGEQTGSLAKTFITLGGIYENKTDTTTKNLTVILEPFLLVIVWLGVVAVALAVVLPIYSLVGGLGSQIH